MSFTLKTGQTLAITGPSGSGKSTLAYALLNLIEHTGSIAINDVEIARIAELNQVITAMLQTTYIFGTNLRENLRIANSMVSDEALIQSLTDAGLRDWFELLPEGLDTVLGSSIRSLSGGEMQRIGIARVLLTPAPFVVLDEPTEHLDEETALALWDTLLRRLSDRGLIVVTHDLRVAASCSAQVVLPAQIERETLQIGRES